MLTSKDFVDRVLQWKAEQKDLLDEMLPQATAGTR